MLLSKASFPGQAAAIPAVAAAELLNIAPVYSVDRIFTRSFCTSCGSSGAKVHDSAAMVKFGRTMSATGARKAGAMRALVVTADLGGNLPPTFSVARALQRRGVEITFAGLDLANTHFRTTRFEVALAITPERGGKGLRKGVAMARLAAGRAAAREAQRLITEAQPDVVLVDCMLIAPLRGVLAAGRPTAVLFHTFGEYWSHDFDRGPAGRVLALLGLRPRKLWRAAAARLLLTDAELDRGSTTPEMRDYTWVGSTEPGTEPLARGNRDRVLVALSATDWPGMLPVYRSIVAALAALPVEAVVTSGGVVLGDELRGAANVTVNGWLPHDSLLPEIDLVIGHGGHSTTLKALAHGIPLLVLPINPILDQRRVGRTLEAAGVARVLRRAASASEIRAAVTAILEDQPLRDRAAATGRRLRHSPPGGEVAAARILTTIRQAG